MTFQDRDTLVVLEGSSGAISRSRRATMPPACYPASAGNSVISAHRDTHFRELEHARVGDRISVRARRTVSDLAFCGDRRESGGQSHDAPRAR